MKTNVSEAPIMKMEAAWPLKRQFPTTALHGVTTQKTSTWNITTVKPSNS